MIKVSIIVAVYNSQEYIERCIASLASQTLKELEILLIDDGSTDLSGEICLKYANKNENVFYYKKENGGAASARNFGMRLARGKYFCFVDSDDYIDNEAVLTMYLSAEKQKADIVSCGYFMHNGKSVSRISAEGGSYSGSEINSRIVELKSKNLIDSPCNKLYLTEFVRSSGILMPEGEPYEDTDFNLRLLTVLPKIVLLDECFYHYILHMGSATRHYNPQKLEIIKKRARLLKECTATVDDYCDFYFVKSVFSAIIDMFLSCKSDEIKATVRRECLSPEFRARAEGCRAEGRGAAVIKRVAISGSVNRIYGFLKLCYILKYKMQKLFLRVR